MYRASRTARRLLNLKKLSREPDDEKVRQGTVRYTPQLQYSYLMETAGALDRRPSKHISRYKVLVEVP